MSKDKHRNRDRKIKFLNEFFGARKCGILSFSPTGIPLNCPGGIGADNPVLLDLVREGAVEMFRYDGKPKHLPSFYWARKLRAKGHTSAFVRVTYAKITEKGKCFLLKLNKAT